MSIVNITANLTPSAFAVRGNDVYVQTNGNPGMLLVHATWCGHCVNFIPVYQKICKKLNNSAIVFPCLAIESEQLEKSDLGEKLGISGFPTILFFDQTGKIVGKYKGNREESDILNSVCKMFHYCANSG